MEGLFRATSAFRRLTTWDDFREAVFNEKNGVGISSFSEEWDSPLMWAHYTNGFRGMCIRYDRALLERSLPHGSTIIPVNYSELPKKFDAQDVCGEREVARAVLSQKHVAWNYEREWRLLKPEIGTVRHDRRAIRAIFFGARVSKAAAARIANQLDLPWVQIYTTKLTGYRIEIDERIDRS